MAKRAAGFLIFRFINDQIEYLLLKASYGSFHWTPPKGHVDPGEDDYTTAMRETLEEAGFVSNDLIVYKDQRFELNYKVKGNDKVVVYWLAKLRNSNQNPVLSDEHTEYRWLSKQEALALSSFSDFARMVEHFHQKIPQLTD